MDQRTDFLIHFLPIALAHIALPPLSYFSGENFDNEILDEFFRFIYSVTPQSFLSRKFIYSLVNDSSNGVDFEWTMLTHIFVHTSYEHMFGNLSAALQFAYPVYNEFGAVGLYFLFLSGGAFASLPTFLRQNQKSAFSQLVYDRIAIRPSGETYSKWIPGGVRDLWNMAGASNVAAILGKIIPTKSCGSSGSCYALMGCDLALLVRDCYQTIAYVLSSKDETNSYYFYQGNRSRINRNGEIIIGNGTFITNFNEFCRYVDTKIKKLFKVALSSNGRFFYKLLNIYSSIKYCRGELNAIYPIHATGFKFSDPTFFEKASDLFYVGHAEHIQGFFYGVTFGCIFGIIVPTVQKHFRKNS